MPNDSRGGDIPRRGGMVEFIGQNPDAVEKANGIGQEQNRAIAIIGGPTSRHFNEKGAAIGKFHRVGVIRPGQLGIGRASAA